MTGICPENPSAPLSCQMSLGTIGFEIAYITIALVTLLFMVKLQGKA